MAATPAVPVAVASTGVRRARHQGWGLDSDATDSPGSGTSMVFVYVWFLSWGFSGRFSFEAPFLISRGATIPSRKLPVEMVLVSSTTVGSKVVVLVGC